MDAYLFDLDGTLVDSREDIAHSANHARVAVGLPPRPVAEIYDFIGEGARRLIERTVGAEHADLVPAALAAWHAHYEQHMLDTTRAYDGVADALARLGAPCAVVTNKPGASARQLVAALGLARWCPVVVGGGDVPTRKPDPEGVRLAIARLGADGRAVLVGDSGIDAATAKAAGIAFVGVLWGLRPRVEMEAQGASIFVARADELPDAIERALRVQPRQ